MNTGIGMTNNSITLSNVAGEETIESKQIDTLNPNELSSEKYLSALDIGSNSFHFVFARVVKEHLQILYSEKYQVKLASGLDTNNKLNDAAIERAVNALTKIAPLTKQLTRDNFRAVATYTLREAKNTHKLLKAAAHVFPFDIEVISGHEEARLIYQGVAHHSAPGKQRLIIDIGGGSTECVLGKNFETKYLTSLNIGCVSFQNQFFSDKAITAENFDRAIMKARLEVESHVKRFTKLGWHEVLGTSGTMKAIYQFINQHNSTPSNVSLSELYRIKDTLIACGHADNIKLTNIKESRRHIIAPGLAILIGLVEMLEIASFQYCPYSLREGVLFQQLEQLNYKDIRQRTVNSLSSRFNIDKDQAESVNTLAQTLFGQVKKEWQLEHKTYRLLLMWACQLHEIGFDINPSAYHKHGSYILTHADLAGFNVEQQYALAYLVGSHRKKIQLLVEHPLNALKQEKIERCLIVLRLAVLLNQQRQLTESATFESLVNANELMITFPKKWLSQNAIIKEDLTQESTTIKKLGVNLLIQ